MNSKELLEQAEQRITEVESIKLAKQNIVDLERLLDVSEDESYELRYCGEYDLPLEQSLDVNDYEDLKGIVRGAFRMYLSMQEVKMEKLLGIRKPATINPDFEKAVQEMERKVVIVHPDPVVEKLTDETRRDKRCKYPMNMTEETVKEMYIVEAQSMDNIAKHFGVKKSTVNNFIYLHGLRRTTRKNSKPLPGKNPTETERP